MAVVLKDVLLFWCGVWIRASDNRKIVSLTVNKQTISSEWIGQGSSKHGACPVHARNPRTRSAVVSTTVMHATRPNQTPIFAKAVAYRHSVSAKERGMLEALIKRSCVVHATL